MIIDAIVFQGVVETVGSEVTEFAVGDRVAAVNWATQRHDEAGETIAGAFATHITISSKKLSLIPTGVTDEQAAAIALVGTTAWQALFDAGAVNAGTRLLVLGGSTAVGATAIQLAKAKGAWVATTASTRNLEFVQGWGADRVINYETEKWDEVLTEVDAVLDATGEQQGWSRAEKIIKAGGTFVSLANADVGYNPAGHPPLSFAAFFCLSNSRAVLDELLLRVGNGSLTIAIDEVFPFTEAGVKDLFRKNAEGKSKGKNLLRIA